MTGAKWANGDDRRLIRRAMKAPLLSREEERALAIAWHEDGDRKALSKLTEAYLRLVISVAARYRHYGLQAGDLIQEGVVGLMEAAARFDPSRDVRFSTYASWWIRAAIQDFVLRNWSIVRTGTTAAHKALFFNLKRLKARIAGTTERPLSIEDKREIADQMGVKMRDLEAMEGRLSGVDRSLNAPVTEDTTKEWQDLIPSTAPSPEAAVVADNAAIKRGELLGEALKTLTPRELYIIEKRRLQEESVTLAGLGEELGISKERVRQLEVQALSKLKAAILSQSKFGDASKVVLGFF